MENAMVYNQLRVFGAAIRGNYLGNIIRECVLLEQTVTHILQSICTLGSMAYMAHRVYCASYAANTTLCSLQAF